MFSMLNMVKLFMTVNILRPLLAFHPEMFLANLKYMGLGMLCIIIVMAVIICVVLFLNKASSVIAAKKSEKDSQDNQ